MTIDEASEFVGVPVAQLQRWAYLGVGPKNLGTKRKPIYSDDDLTMWKKDRTVPINADCAPPE